MEEVRGGDLALNSLLRAWLSLKRPSSFRAFKQLECMDKYIDNNHRSSGFRSNPLIVYCDSAVSYGPKLLDHTHQATSTIAC